MSACTSYIYLDLIYIIIEKNHNQMYRLDSSLHTLETSLPLLLKNFQAAFQLLDNPHLLHCSYSVAKIGAMATFKV